MSEPLDCEFPEPDSFKLFWSVYPRRKDKIRAAANFRRALKVDSAENIIAGACWYAAAVEGWETSAIQMPDSWLSRERWRAYAVSDSEATRVPGGHSAPGLSLDEPWWQPEPDCRE